MQANVEVKKQYVVQNAQIRKAYMEPKLAELGSVSAFTLTIEPGSSHVCGFTPKNLA